VGTSRIFWQIRDTATDFELRVRVHFTEFCEIRLSPQAESKWRSSANQLFLLFFIPRQTLVVVAVFFFFGQ